MPKAVQHLPASQVHACTRYLYQVPTGTNFQYLHALQCVLDLTCLPISIFISISTSTTTTTTSLPPNLG